jgi:hypothetical protein
MIGKPGDLRSNPAHGEDTGASRGMLRNQETMQDKEQCYAYGRGEATFH